MQLCLVYNLKLVIIITKKKRNLLSQLRGFIMHMCDLYTTYFGPKGPSSDDTYIKITKKSYWFIYAVASKCFPNHFLRNTKNKII
jgi:hypothetical protein